MDLSAYKDRAMESWDSDGKQEGYWRCLATGPTKRLRGWLLFVVPELLDRQGQTVRICLWVRPGADPADVVNVAIQHARTWDVTLQLLCELHGPSEYPVLHLGTHGMKWGIE
jgi:hypothetical protein